MKSIWKGTLGFGLINIPVALMSASKERVLAFHMFDRKDNCPISYKKPQAIRQSQMRKSLPDYHKKRRFNKTPEPESTSKSGKKRLGDKDAVDPLRFVIHEHYARRHHYDLRLELGGVLKSWAVPNGPPQTAGEKRLAVHVEDHPLSYATFKGKIPEGNYGAGEVYIWDEGYYSSPYTKDRKSAEKRLRDEYGKGIIHILLVGSKLKGLYTLVRTNDKNWLFMLKQDAHHAPTLPMEKKGRESDDQMPHAVRPMLAESVSGPFDDKDWIFERKWDGYRIVSEIRKGKVSLYSRKGQDYTDKFSAVAESLRSMRRNCVLDGEVVALDKKGNIDFQLLQDHEINRAPLQYVVFDLLYLDGKDLRDEPLEKRKELLRSVIPARSKEILFSEHVDGKGRRIFAQFKKKGWEGIIAKKKGSFYESARSHSWLKIKSFDRQEAIICGFTRPRGARQYFGALILGIYQKDKLTYIGHIGTGFNDVSLRSTFLQLDKLKISRCPFDSEPETNAPATWVRPELVCEVKFSGWTNDGLMRHPVFLGLRDDKSPVNISKENDRNAQTRPTRLKGSKDPIGDFSNLDKLYFPKDGYTKGDIIRYYDRISRFIIPYLKGRPESMNRFPGGIEDKNFYQKNVSISSMPPFVDTVRIRSEHEDRDIDYVVCNNKETLLYMANLGCIELNPWNSRVGSLDEPDYMIIDLDPGERTFGEVVKVALATKKILDESGLASFVKTSGKKGIHILVPLGANYSYEDVRDFSKILVLLVHQNVPDLTSVERVPRKRGGRIYLDYLQNRKGQTIAAPYCVRPWPGATVSTPLTWEEVKPGLDPRNFTIATMDERLKRAGDLFEGMLDSSVDLRLSLDILKRIMIQERF